MCQRFNYLPLILETGNTWKHLVTSRDTFPTNFNLWLQKVFSPFAYCAVVARRALAKSNRAMVAASRINRDTCSHDPVAQLSSMGELTMGERIFFAY